MAKTVVTTDDIDGSAEATTIEFSFDGTSYTIDLAKKNKAAFEKALKPYLEAATTTSRRRTSRSSPAARPRSARSARGSSSRTDTAAVRTWAGEQGIEVSERGRIAREVLEAYRAAH